MGLLNYNYRDITDKIKNLGYSFHRTGKGSHMIWYNPDTNIFITVPNHGNQSISHGVVKSIIRDIKLTNKQFQEL